MHFRGQMFHTPVWEVIGFNLIAVMEPAQKWTSQSLNLGSILLEPRSLPYAQ
jgi:hypothetical protein